MPHAPWLLEHIWSTIVDDRLIAFVVDEDSVTLCVDGVVLLELGLVSLDAVRVEYPLSADTEHRSGTIAPREVQKLLDSPVVRVDALLGERLGLAALAGVDVRDAFAWAWLDHVRLRCAADLPAVH